MYNKGQKKQTSHSYGIKGVKKQTRWQKFISYALPIYTKFKTPYKIVSYSVLAIEIGSQVFVYWFCWYGVYRWFWG